MVTSTLMPGFSASKLLTASCWYWLRPEFGLLVVPELQDDVLGMAIGRHGKPEHRSHQS